METMFYRAVIYTSDIILICGVSDRAARKKLQVLRNQYQKERGQYITIEEFCFATGIPIERVYEHFKAIGERRLPHLNRDENETG